MSKLRPYSPLKTDRRRRPGFTLLEIILALAILAGAIAILTEAVRGARRNGLYAARLTTAELIAVSKMAEIAAAATPLATVSNSPCEFDPEFTYSVVTASTSIEGLVSVSVTVACEAPGRSQPLEFTLVRWMTDPGVELSAAVDETDSDTDSSGDSDAM